jgi:hypothetical protein
MNGLIKLLTKLSVYYCRNPDDLIGWEAHSSTIIHLIGHFSASYFIYYG